MIALFQPRSTRPKNRRFPLSILSLAAMLEGREDYRIVDGNLETDPLVALDDIMRETPARALAVSVMPGPQMVAAVETTRVAPAFAAPSAASRKFCMCGPCSTGLPCASGCRMFCPPRLSKPPPDRKSVV